MQVNVSIWIELGGIENKFYLLSFQLENMGFLSFLFIRHKIMHTKIAFIW